MKRNAFSLISLLSLLLVAGSAIAQTINVRADVPFGFTVNKATLPSGAYEIQSATTANGVLILRGPDGNSMMLGSNAAECLQGANKTKLVFNKYGTQYFLSEIWVAGEVRGRQIPKTAREKELAKDFSSHPVEILASLR